MKNKSDLKIYVLGLFVFYLDINTHPTRSLGKKREEENSGVTEFRVLFFKVISQWKDEDQNCPSRDMSAVVYSRSFIKTCTMLICFKSIQICLKSLAHSFCLSN